MPFDLTIPLIKKDNLTLTLQAGDIMFVLGANGAGKSGLMHLFFRTHLKGAKRISAHRQTWFQHGGISMTAVQRRDTETNARTSDNQPAARWMEQYTAHRANMAIYDLLDAENVRARGIAAAVDADDVELMKQLKTKDAPIKVINELMRLSNMPIEISVHEAEQIRASKWGGEKYSIAELSDGERNALLIAATVLTAKPGTLMLVDEPERHLHRSIIAPLLGHLFAKRPDCTFVVSTHEVMLPVDHRQATTLLVRSCKYEGELPRAWDADLLGPQADLDEVLKKDILGSRRKVVFVEGEEGSLDKPLYSLLFPSASVIAKESCRDVEHAVTGIRDAADLHWINAFGIIDGDGRTIDEIQDLKTNGVYVLPMFAIESVYYHPEIQCRIAKRHSQVTGGDASALVTAAKAAAMSALKPHAQRMSERAAEKAIRERVFKQLPKRATIAAAVPICVSIDVQQEVAAELARFQALINEGDLSAIIARYPVRESPALDQVAIRLGFQRMAQYEGAVRKLLLDDEDSLGFVRSLFGTLAADIVSS